jgi:cytosolic carboxypeptidase protein 2/3
MMNSLKPDVDLIDRSIKRSITGHFEDNLLLEKRIQNEKISKWSSYWNSIYDQLRHLDQEPNEVLKHVNASNLGDSPTFSCSNMSQISIGPVKLPYIGGGESPFSDGLPSYTYEKTNTHHYSASDSNRYAIGVGQTVSSQNLKATVSGGKFSFSGVRCQEDKERIEFKCSPNGKITKVIPSKFTFEDGDPQYNGHYHRFRQKTLSAVKPSFWNFYPSKNLIKNKFPLPYTGIEYPFIDGEGVATWQIDDKYNDFEKSWLYSMPEKFSLTPNDRPNYKKKTKMDNKMNKIVYDCLNTSPYYSPTTQAEHNVAIDLNREWVNNSTLEDQKFKTEDFSLRKDKFYAYLLPYYALKDEFDNTLVFESRFESGNLRRAFKKLDTEYELMLKTDYNTNNYTQWFYFKVSNTRRGVPYTFKIINMVKPDSLYNHGMKVLSFSIKTRDIHQAGWRRVGKNISYTQNNYKRKGSGNYYTLSFTVTFDYDHDSVFFAHCFPYTFTDLKYLLSDVWTDSLRWRIRKTFLTRTLAGNEFEGVIITNFTSRPEDIAERKWVVITGRVHPGESNSSFIVEGIIRYLVSDESAAISLRNRFVFKIVPMLNPDGVIIGNYRCSLSGNDLNRQWKNPSPKFHPEIYAVKEMFQKTLKWRDVYCYVDCHGHSRKKNAFMYGWNSKCAIGYSKYREKAIPFMLSKNSESFSFKDCNFTVQKTREGTARFVVHNEYNVVNSFTLEASFFGPENGLYQDCHFTPTQLAEIGKKFCITLNEYSEMIRKPNSPYSQKDIAFELQPIFQEIDNYFGTGQDIQSKNYMKFMSKGDESDSADDDEPEIWNLEKRKEYENRPSCTVKSSQAKKRK